MFIDIIPLQKNTARLTRVYGDTPCAALPASVPGPEGGVLAITELGDYCFSEKPRSLPGADALCQRKLCAGVEPQLVGLFGPWLPIDLSGERGFHLEHAAGHPQPAQAVSPAHPGSP